MPELPEVETTRRGLEPLVIGRRIRQAVVRNRAMRQPVPRGLTQSLAGATVRALGRRGKYLLFDCGAGTLILHLGMSGRLWVVRDGAAPEKHDHFDMVLDDGTIDWRADDRSDRARLAFLHRRDLGVIHAERAHAFQRCIHVGASGREIRLRLLELTACERIVLE